MKSKNVKVVDEHSIDRSASVLFAFDLEGSEYRSDINYRLSKKASELFFSLYDYNGNRKQ